MFLSFDHWVIRTPPPHTLYCNEPEIKTLGHKYCHKMLGISSLDGFSYFCLGRWGENPHLLQEVPNIPGLAVSDSVGKRAGREVCLSVEN